MAQKSSQYYRVPRIYSPHEDIGEYSDSDIEEPRQKLAMPKWIPKNKEKMIPATAQIRDFRYNMPDTRYIMPEQYSYTAALPRVTQHQIPMARVRPVVNQVPIPQRAHYYSPNLMAQPLPSHMYKTVMPAAVPKIPYMVTGGLPMTEKSATVQQVRPAYLKVAKAPVSTATPRYYKRPANRINRRPSVLCMPMVNRRDPAVTNARILQPRAPSINCNIDTLHKSNVPPSNTTNMHVHPQSAPITRVATPNKHNMVSGERLQRIKNLLLPEYTTNNIFQRTVSLISCDENMSVSEYGELEKEQAGSDNEHETGRLTPTLEDNHITQNEKLDVQNIPAADSFSLSQLLKPRLPPSLKALQKTIKKEQAFESTKDYNLQHQTQDDPQVDDNKTLQQMTNEVLDNMFQDLNATDAINKDISAPESHNENIEKAPSSKFDTNTDISDNEQVELDELHNSSAANQDSRRKSVWTRTSTPKSLTTRECLPEQSPTDVNQSVKYVVQLIDRALSRELGASPDHTTFNQRQRPTTAQVTGSMDIRSCRNNDARSVAESLPPYPHSINRSAPSQNNDLECHVSTEEIESIDRMKKLRWHYLKQIQREVRQLEHVERFLDSFSFDKH